jgi:type I restriction enzyme S subunit
LLPIPDIKLQNQICEFLEAVETRQSGNKSLELPTLSPLLADVRRIVARVEELAGKVEEVRGLRSQTFEKVNFLLQSARRKMIGEAPAEGWIPLRTYVETIENGKSPSCEARPALDGEWGVVKVGCVSFGTFDPSANKALPSTLQPNPIYEIQPSDFLMSRANTTHLVGACAIVEQTRPRLLLSDKTFRFIFKKTQQVNLRYLDQVMKSPALRSQIEQQATGTSLTMKNISKEKVMSLLVPHHSQTEQCHIVAYLDDLQAKVEGLKQLQAETEAEINALLPSILNKAFKGEL